MPGYSSKTHISSKTLETHQADLMVMELFNFQPSCQKCYAFTSVIDFQWKSKVHRLTQNLLLWDKPHNELLMGFSQFKKFIKTVFHGWVHPQALMPLNRFFSYKIRYISLHKLDVIQTYVWVSYMELFILCILQNQTLKSFSVCNHISLQNCAYSI